MIRPVIGELHSEMGIGLHAEFKPKGLFTLIGESATDRVGGSESNGCGLKTAELRERQKSSNTFKTHTIDKQIHMTDSRRVNCRHQRTESQQNTMDRYILTCM